MTEYVYNAQATTFTGTEAARTTTFGPFLSTDTITITKPSHAVDSRLLYDAWSAWSTEQSFPEWQNDWEIRGNNGGPETPLLHALWGGSVGLRYDTESDAYNALNALCPLSFTGYTYYTIIRPDDPVPADDRGGISLLLTVTPIAPIEIHMDTVESSSAIYTPKFDVSLSAAPAPEHNPYKPVVPEVMRDRLGLDGYSYLEENQEILRQQHNLLQAGDTTFPYQLTITSHKTPHYNPGSVSRFYHADFGIIQARYVQFAEMVPVANAHCPVGLFRSRDSLEWIVTNDYNKSHPDLVVGISAPWTLPANSDYGWVIVDGPILQQVGNHSATFAIGEPFAWESSGYVSNAAAGKIIGRRVNKPFITRLTPGSMWVRTESFSEAQINSLINSSTQSLLDELHSLELQLAALPSAAVLRTLQATVTSLRTTLSNEASARIASDLRLNERISNLNFVTQTQLNNAITNASNALDAQITNLNNTIAFLTGRLNDTDVRLGEIIGVEARIQQQLDAIQELINYLTNLKRNKFPVVDGSVPPNLVYLDDGSLVYAEE